MKECTCWMEATVNVGSILDCPKHKHGPAVDVATDARRLAEKLREYANRGEQSATERFESDAERFHAETGYLAPGKSVPLAMADGGYDERRAPLWQEWVGRQQRNYIATLRIAADALDMKPKP